MDIEIILDSETGESISGNIYDFDITYEYNFVIQLNDFEIQLETVNSSVNESIGFDIEVSLDKVVNIHSNVNLSGAIIDDTTISTSTTWSSQKINNELSTKASISHSHTITDISDFNITTPTNNQILKYNSTLGKWENADFTHTHTTSDITDFNIQVNNKISAHNTDANAHTDIRNEIATKPDINDTAPSTSTVYSSQKIEDILSTKSDITHTHTLDSLSNVDTSTKLDGQVLYWDNNSNLWKTKTITIDSSTFINDTTTSTTTTWSSQKINNELSTKANADLSNVSDTNVLNKIKNVDGSGSGLDADTLDGLQSTQFLRSDVSDTLDGTLTINERLYFPNSYSVSLSLDGNIVIGSTSSYNLTINKNEILTRNNGTSAHLYINKYGGRIYFNSSVSANGQSPLIVGSELYKVWHEGNDGAGSGLDADTLDGLQSTQFLRSDTNDALNGTLFIINDNSLVVGNTSSNRVSGSGIELYGVTSSAFLSVQDGNGRIQLKWNATRGTNEKYLVSNEPAGMWEFDPITASSDLFRVRYAPNGTAGNTIAWQDILKVGTGEFTYKGYKVWHEGNDGSGSGLDADTLDGKQSWEFATASHSHLLGSLLDVDTTGVSDGQALTYDGASGKWKPSYSSGGASHLNDLLDVDTIQLRKNSIITYDNSLSKWFSKDISNLLSNLVTLKNYLLDTKPTVLIPFYRYPYNTDWDSQWETYLSIVRDYHSSVNFITIVNPNDGAGTVLDIAYRRLIKRIISSGSGVIGYVSTQYASRPIADVKADIDNWLNFYPDIQGIFLDEFPYDYTTANYDYYKELVDYIRNVKGLPFIVANPGTKIPPEWFKLEDFIDVFFIWETNSLPTESDLGANEDWEDSYREIVWQKKGVLAYSIPDIQPSDIKSIIRWVKYIYITDDGADGNPWDSLSSYFTKLVKILSQIQGDNNFDYLMSRQGYQVLPSGLILQWGETTLITTSNQTYSGTWMFPKPFTTDVYFADVSVIETSNTGDITATVRNLSGTSFDYFLKMQSSASRSFYLKFLAIGI